MPNISARPIPWMSTFRKLAIGAWKRPNDPTIYGKVNYPIDACLDYIKNNKDKGPISLNHIIAKCMAMCCDKYPDINRVLIRNKVYHRDDISVFFQTHLSTKKGYDLLGVNLKNIHQHSLTDIARLVHEKTKALKQNKISEMERSKAVTKWTPLWCMSGVIKIFDFIMYTLNINLSWMGFPSDAYGSFMITSIGSLGMQEGYVPLFPFSRCGAILAVGKPYKALEKEGDSIEEKNYVTVTYTLDHRYFDGAHFAKPLAYFKTLMANPSRIG